MKNAFLRSIASGKNPVASSGLGTKLRLSSFLSFLRALTTTDADFLGFIEIENGREEEEEEENGAYPFVKMKDGLL